SSSVEKKFWWSVVFTAPLLVHMFIHIPLLHNPVIQLLLSLPVMVIGIGYFGKSAWGSIRAGLPNMDVLIFIGSAAAFLYSVMGMYLYQGSSEVYQYLYFETAAAIICFVLLGNVLEHRSVVKTSSALHELTKLQPQKTKRLIADGNLVEISVKEVKKGDLLLIASGDGVPVDGVIKEGSAAL